MLLAAKGGKLGLQSRYLHTINAIICQVFVKLQDEILVKDDCPKIHVVSSSPDVAKVMSSQIVQGASP